MKPKETRTAPPTFRVRRANEFDLGAWAALRAALWPEGAVEAHRAELPTLLADEARQAVFIAVDREGAGVAFAEVRLRDTAESCDSSPVGYLEGWYVVPALRGQGIGRALVDAACAWAKSKGCTEFASDTLLDNLVGRAAHEALGFVKAETLVHYKKRLH